MRAPTALRLLPIAVLATGCMPDAVAGLEHEPAQGLSQAPDAGKPVRASSQFLAVCGDGVTQSGELCDDGNTVTETACPYGVASCTACDATCFLALTLSGPYCGDGEKNAGEVCDDGNAVDETQCPYGAPSCLTCNAQCSGMSTLDNGAFCGDGKVNGQETCDDANVLATDGCAACNVSQGYLCSGSPSTCSVASVFSLASNTRYGFLLANESPPSRPGMTRLTRTGTTSSTADACGAVSPGSLSGSVVLIRAGGCTLYQKALNAQAAGAVGVLVYNDAAGAFSANVAGSPAVTIPVGTLSGMQGAALNEELNLGPVTVVQDGIRVAPYP